MRTKLALFSVLSLVSAVGACGSSDQESGPVVTIAQAGGTSASGSGGSSAGHANSAGGASAGGAINGGAAGNPGLGGANSAGANAGNPAAGATNSAGGQSVGTGGASGTNAASGSPSNGGDAGAPAAGGQPDNAGGSNDAGGVAGADSAGGNATAGGSGGSVDTGGTSAAGGSIATLCAGVAAAALEPPTSCNGPSGDTSKQIPGDNVYSTSWFGCYAKSDGTIVQDPTDNCEFACGSGSYCPSSQSGPECEAGLKWFSADADRYGCGSHILLTNCDNGKQVIVATLDRGPNCGDEQSFGTPVIDMSHDAMIYLFDGQTYGGSDEKRIIVEMADMSTTLGPVQLVTSRASEVPARGYSLAMRAPPPPPSWASSLFTIGVTGTNGKTSTTAMIAALLQQLARPVARVTTVGSFLDDEALDVPAHYDGFLETMKRARDAGGAYAAVELTSEALSLGFAKAWPFRIGVFTNLSHDHSDAHGSPEHYLASKAQLFMALPAGGTAVLNCRDDNAELLAEVLPDGVELIGYGVSSRGDSWRVAEVEVTATRVSWEGTSFELAPSSRFPQLPRELAIRAIGDVFVENAVAALSAAICASVPISTAASALASAAPPPGRFEVVHREPYVVVDYAHTPDAMTRTLHTARRLCTGKLTVVFGAGGHRDRLKRPLLGEAARAADRVVLTSDNPRDEDPSEIIKEISAGLFGHKNVIREPRRERAIALALADAGERDVVVVAGKGHERTQETNSIQTSFSDADIIREIYKHSSFA